MIQLFQNRKGTLMMLTAILMASGFSRRMKQNKLLLDFNGRPIIEYTMEAIHASPFAHKLLVAKDPAVITLGEKYGFQIIKNSNSSLGQSESIRLGVHASKKDSSFMFFVGDQPFLTTELITDLTRFHLAHPDKIILPTHNGKKGNPTIFPASLRHSLLKISGDTGGKTVIKNNPDKVLTFEISDPLSLFDVDTISDFEQIKKRNT
jgi:molybdenum cofactor cytidylyltransferase